MSCRVDYTRYPRNWRKVSRTMRKLAGGRCEWCGCAAITLSVHHLGAPYPGGRSGDPHDKHDVRRENLAALCFACHNKVEQIGRIRRVENKRRARRRASVPDSYSIKKERNSVKTSTFAPPQFVIFVYSQDGQRIAGLASIQNLEKTRRLAQSVMALYPEASHCDLHAYTDATHYLAQPQETVYRGVLTPSTPEDLGT